MTRSLHVPKYGPEYIAWKNWVRDGSFGRLDPLARVYFAAEMRRTACTCIRDVLEVGFGEGAFLAYARLQDWNITGTEVNPMLIDQARQAGFNALHADALAAVPAEAFDLIAAFDVIEHLESEDICSFLSLLKGKLKPGGVVLARFPNGDSPLGLPAHNGDITHLSVLGRGKVEYFARAVGFDLAFIGGQAQPLLVPSLKIFVQRLIAIPITMGLEFITRSLFFSRKAAITFFSSNLVIVLRKPAARSGEGR